MSKKEHCIKLLEAYKEGNINLTSKDIDIILSYIKETEQ